MSSNVRQIPSGYGLRKVERNEGEAFDVAGARFTWKVKGKETGIGYKAALGCQIVGISEKSLYSSAYLC
jgi:hypothetical protein